MADTKTIIEQAYSASTTVPVIEDAEAGPNLVATFKK